MKTKLTIPTLTLLASIASAEWIATLCPVSLTNETAVLFGDAPQYIKGASGTVYKAGWARIEIPNSGTHTNVFVAVLGEFLPTFPTLGKSVGIHGIDDPNEFLVSIGAVRCNADGTIPEEESADGTIPEDDI